MGGNTAGCHQVTPSPGEGLCVSGDCEGPARKAAERGCEGVTRRRQMREEQTGERAERSVRVGKEEAKQDVGGTCKATVRQNE